VLVYFGYPRPHELSCAINKGEADRGEGAAAVGIASRALIGWDGIAHRKAIGSSEAGGDLGSAPMCDYSLHHVQSRAAKVGDKLVTHRFNYSTSGFSAPEDMHVAVCVLPGTELSFTKEVKRAPASLWPWSRNIIHHKTAIFRQVNLDNPRVHHDALEFPDGELVLLTHLVEGQQATVLQLPAAAVGSRLPQPLTYVALPPMSQ
jgi:hypothetical protein